jgi:hypothetical protein
MTQHKAAGLVGVSRATFAQWEGNRHLPGEENVRELDRLLNTKGALVEAAGHARTGAPPRLRPVEPTQPARSQVPSVLQVLDDARRVLLDQLCCDENGTPTGWRHNLVPAKVVPSTPSTAYGLKVLAMHGGPDARTPAVVKWVLDQAVVDRAGRRIGWRARAQAAPRMEITAAVVDALLRAGVALDVDDVLRMLEKLVDDTTLARPSILSVALEPLLRIAPGADLTIRLIDALLACRIRFDGKLLWPEKRLQQRDQLLLTPSVVHTAQAVTVLRSAPDDLVGDAVREAERWIAKAEDLNGITEIIIRDSDAGRDQELLPLHRFTSAWVVRMLAGAAVPDRRRIEYALKYVWERYDPDHHLWAWGNGDTPVWMLHDAVVALHDSALALHTGPANNAGSR